MEEKLQNHGLTVTCGTAQKAIVRTNMQMVCGIPTTSDLSRCAQPCIYNEGLFWRQQMTEREKMLAGQLYDCGDKELLERWHCAKDLARNYNNSDSLDSKAKERILKELLGGYGKNLWITAPFHVDYGNNIYFGNNCEVNMNCTFLDDNVIKIGNNALIAPNVQIYDDLVARLQTVVDSLRGRQKT